MLRDASGVVADSLNYGGLSDPWAAEGYQAASGGTRGRMFCGIARAHRVRAMNAGVGASTGAPAAFLMELTPTATALISLCRPRPCCRLGPLRGAERQGRQRRRLSPRRQGDHRSRSRQRAWRHSKCRHSRGDHDGQRGSCRGYYNSRDNAFGFRDGQTITIGSGNDVETVTISAIRHFEGPSIVVAVPLKQAHHAGTQVSGTGITLNSALTRAHAAGTQLGTKQPTPGTPNLPGSTDTASADQ